MDIIKDIMRGVGTCVYILALLVVYVIAKVLYWVVMGIKLIIALLIALQ